MRDSHGNQLPPIQPGQFQPSYPPPGYGGPPQPPIYPPAPPLQPPHRYNGWTLAIMMILYWVALIMAFIDVSVVGTATSGVSSNSGTTSSSGGFGVVLFLSTFLIIALEVFIAFKDGRNFFTLFGKIHWRRMKRFPRICLGFVYLVGWFMTPTYIIMAIRYHLRTNRQTLGAAMHSGWQGYRAKSRNAQIGLALLSSFLIVSVVLFTGFGTMADRANAMGLVTPVVSPGSTSTPQVAAVNTSVPTTDTTTPTPKSRPTPTPKPTPKPTPTQVVLPPTTTPHCAGINNNPWCYDFNAGNLIYYPPSGFCRYFNCIASFSGADDPGDGYIIECQDATYSQSGGESGACSHHGGEMRPLYSH